MNVSDIAKTVNYKDINKVLNGIHAFMADDDHDFFIANGNMLIQEDLELEYDEVLVVNGNLKIEGALIDQFYDEADYSALFVLGNLEAENFICGSRIHVTGDINVNNTLYANSFDMDSLIVDGSLNTKVLIDEGHVIKCSNIKADNIYIAEYRKDFYKDYSNVNILNKKYFIDPTLYERKFVDPDKLYDYISEGKNVIK